MQPITLLPMTVRTRAMLLTEPPDRVKFSWDIGPQWQIETDSDHTSEVEVRFIAEIPRRTRLELEHRHIDQHGPGWQAVSRGVGEDAGWPLYLARYARPVHPGELMVPTTPAPTSTVRPGTCSPPPIRLACGNPAEPESWESWM